MTTPRPQDTDPLRAQDTDREPYAGWSRGPASRTPAGTRVTWFVLGVCVGVLLAVVGMAGIAEAAPGAAPRLEFTGASPDREHPAIAEWLRPFPWIGNPMSSEELVSSEELGGVPLTPKRPTAALAGPLISGEATWCAPTPRMCQSWGNGRLLGAVHSFRWGDDPYRVRVSRSSRFVIVTVLSHCACQNRADKIDLSPAAFSKLAPLPLGRIDVEVEVLR